MKVKINNEWYDLTDFDAYDDITNIGEVQDVDDAPDGNFDVATLEYAFTDCNPRCSDDSLTDSELWELQELMVHHACDVNPLHDGYIAE